MSENKPEIRRLIPGDEAMVDAFLAPHTASSMILRSNLNRAGLAYEGLPAQGVYVGAFVRDSLIGVAAHYWDHYLMVQAPGNAVQIARAALAESLRPLLSIHGPADQVQEIESGLGLSRDVARCREVETLKTLMLTDLAAPVFSADGKIVCRRSQDADLDWLTDWRAEYSVPMLNKPDTPENWPGTRAYIERLHTAGNAFLLEQDGEPVSIALFNAAIPDAVQVSGVWTPPQYRNRGYARAVVAGALEIAKSEGVQQAILFSDETNQTTRRLYANLGFHDVGQYAYFDYEKDPRPVLGKRPANTPDATINPS